MRWSEEVLILREEMRRVREFLQWHATWWREKAHQVRDDITQEHAEGMFAYASRQEYIRQHIRDSFDTLWQGSKELAATGIGASNDILDLDLATSEDPISLLPPTPNVDAAALHIPT